MFHLLRSRLVRSYRSSVALEEETVWVGFYRRAADPAVAAEVIEHLEAVADLKRMHPALYLSCKESLRKNKARLARTKRIRSFLRKVLRVLAPGKDRRRTTPPAGRLAEAIPSVHGRNASVAPVHEPYFEVASQRAEAA